MIQKPMIQAAAATSMDISSDLVLSEPVTGETTLIILTQPPPASLAQVETLQAVLVMASFELPVRLLLTGAAIQWLTRPEQAPAPWADLGSMLASLDLYDLSPVYVDQGIWTDDISTSSPNDIDVQPVHFGQDWMQAFRSILVW